MKNAVLTVFVVIVGEFFKLSDRNGSVMGIIKIVRVVIMSVFSGKGGS